MDTVTYYPLQPYCDTYPYVFSIGNLSCWGVAFCDTYGPIDAWLSLMMRRLDAIGLLALSTTIELVSPSRPWEAL